MWPATARTVARFVTGRLHDWTREGPPSAHQVEEVGGLPGDATEPFLHVRDCRIPGAQRLVDSRSARQLDRTGEQHRLERRELLLARREPQPRLAPV